MKYIDADLLIRKIKGLIRLENLNFAALGGGGQTFCINTLEWVLKQIDSLQQGQQEVDLEEEMEKFGEHWPYPANFDGYDKDWVDELTEECAKHFYELGKNSK